MALQINHYYRSVKFAMIDHRSVFPEAFKNKRKLKIFFEVKEIIAQNFTGMQQNIIHH